MLTCLGFSHTKDRRSYIKVKCDCGKEKIMYSFDFTLKRSISCGCRQHKDASLRTGTPIYKVWDGMMSRCYNKKSISYKRYGGRGITVCERWHEFKFFLEDMLPTYEKGLTLERSNNDGNYEKGNCIWATLIMQARNKSNNKLDIEKVREIRKSILNNAELSRKYNVSRALIIRVKRNELWKE